MSSIIAIVEIAVLGASGFIGATMLRKLMKDGHRVHAVARREPKDPDALATWREADFREICDLEQQVPDLSGIDHVYNFAADMGGVGYFSSHQSGPFVSNSRITFNVLEACIRSGVSRVFLASSACAYPIAVQQDTSNPPRLAEDLLDTGTPDQMYGREKLMQVVLSRHVPLDCRVGVLHTVYGDAFDRGSERNKFPTEICLKTLRARRSGSISVWGDGSQMRSYLWVDDAVRRIGYLMDSPTNPGPTNIGYEGAISVLDVLQICASHLGLQPIVHLEPEQPTGVPARDCDNSKFNSLFENDRLVTPDEGFPRLLDRLLAEHE